MKLSIEQIERIKQENEGYRRGWEIGYLEGRAYWEPEEEEYDDEGDLCDELED